MRSGTVAPTPGFRAPAGAAAVGGVADDDVDALTGDVAENDLNRDHALGRTSTPSNRQPGPPSTRVAAEADVGPVAGTAK
jgi:hypothetical protein